jgi:ribonuclease J
MNNDVFTGKNGFFFASIGGSEQIGLNCLLYICDGKILIVDMGVGFPDSMPGVQVIVPDLSYIFSRKNQVLGLIVTHIHEDHCGALPYLLKYFPELKIYSTNFTLNFIQAKLDESGYKDKINSQVVKDFEILKLGKETEDENDDSGFDIEFVGLTHSTIEMMALYIKTKYGTIFHTGDWKLDDAPVVGSPINRERLKCIGDKGVTAMICDSTNVMVSGHSKSEGSLAGEFERLIKSAKSRVIITLFASNVGRISTLLSIANKLGKKVCLVGRAVARVVNAAMDSGYLQDFPGNLIINEVEANQFSPDELIVLCTGCQAEPLAALTKIVSGRHRHLKFSESDTVIFSSKTIPGNERRVLDLYNHICRYNAVLITHETNQVHVSGHPARDELKEMYSLIKPQISIPVHGENLHIREHTKFALDTCKVSKVIAVRNGDVVQINNEHSGVINEIRSGFLCVDGKLFRRQNDPVIKTRNKIMENGVLVIFLTFNKSPKSPENKIRANIFAPGLLDEANDKSIMNDLINKLQTELSITVDDKDRKDSFSYIALNIAKKLCKHRLGKDPVIKVHIDFE